MYYASILSNSETKRFHPMYFDSRPETFFRSVAHQPWERAAIPHLERRDFKTLSAQVRHDYKPIGQFSFTKDSILILDEEALADIYDQPLPRIVGDIAETDARIDAVSARLTFLLNPSQ